MPPCIPKPTTYAGPTDEEEAERLLSSSTLDETAALPANLGQGGYDAVPEGQHAVASNAAHSHSE